MTDEELIEALMLAIWDSFSHMDQPTLYGPTKNCEAIVKAFEDAGGEDYWNELLARKLDADDQTRSN